MGRIVSIALAARAAGREVVVIGRAIRRMLDVAGELGMLEGLPPFLDEEAYQHLPRNRVVALVTGSQGEPRAALARIAQDEHRNVTFDRGDTLVFSSRAIPGNEVAINRIMNTLVARGVKIVTDRDRLVHVSGHPRRDEMRDLYGMIRPRIAVPVHGEAMHLAAHAELARELGVPEVQVIKNGDVLRLAPGPAAKVDEVESGRIYRDGTLIGNLEAMGIPARRRLAFNGHVAVSVVLDNRGEVLADPEVELGPAGRRSRRAPVPRPSPRRDRRGDQLNSARAPARPGGGARGGPPRGAGECRGRLGQEAELRRAGLGPMNGG